MVGASLRDCSRCSLANITIMLGEKGLRRRIGVAVERTLKPHEVVESTVYLHIYGDPLTAIVTGLPVNIRTWIAVLTDRRVIILQGDTINAAKSEKAAEFLRNEVTVVSAEPPHKPKRLELGFGDGGSVRFDVPLIWRRDAADFVDGVNTGAEA